MENDSENLINLINTSFFFKEFVYGNNLNVQTNNNTQVELADNIVYLDDIFIVYQIKERCLKDNSIEFEKWFNNKVLNKAVKQIKNTIRLIQSSNKIEISNNRGHRRQLSSISLDFLKKVIVYNPKQQILDKYRFQKFYESKEVGLIHLFHIVDYQWICKYLITPAEVFDYLIFREELFTHQNNLIFDLPEQYVLGHFLSGYAADHIDLIYLNNLTSLIDDIDTFNLEFFFSKFGDKVKLFDNKDDYYPILSEIAKLNRNELREFKKRLIRSIEVCEEEDFIDPFRIAIPRTDCGFVFMPLIKELSIHWKTLLTNITLAHKYDQKLTKCIGVVVFKEIDWHEIYWCYIEAKWEYDQGIEDMIKDIPLRQTKIHTFKGYTFK